MFETKTEEKKSEASGFHDDSAARLLVLNDTGETLGQTWSCCQRDRQSQTGRQATTKFVIFLQN